MGGSTTGLLIIDEVTKESVRYTDDVDLIISVLGYAGVFLWMTTLIAVFA